MTLEFTVGINIAGERQSVTVSAEDALIAALKVKHEKRRRRSTMFGAATDAAIDVIRTSRSALEASADCIWSTRPFSRASRARCEAGASYERRPDLPTGYATSPTAADIQHFAADRVWKQPSVTL